MTDLEHFWSHVMNVAHFSSHEIEHMMNTTAVLHFVFTGTRLSAAFVDASGLVGNAKRLRLPSFNDHLSASDDLLLIA